MAEPNSPLRRRSSRPAVPERKMVGMLEKVLAEVRSGLVSSVVAEAALFPLDVVKLRQQVHGGSAMQILRGVLQEQGLGGLYKGLIGRLIQTITSNVGFFIWQTIALQTAHQRITSGKKLGTGLSLTVNMLAQQFNRLLTTPVDVVANVNQADPKAQGFLHTFILLARTGGAAALWRGLPVALILSLNPALMFTLVDRLSSFVRSFRQISSDETMAATDMFWISGISKAVATVATYPLIRAKAVQQSRTSADGAALGLWATLAVIFQRDGIAGLYSGVWMLSYKTVIFNSMMMALKQQFGILESKWKLHQAHKEIDRLNLDELRRNLVSKPGMAKPWDVQAKGSDVVYTDGSWNYLHDAQEHIIKEAAERGAYLIVGVHNDQTHRDALGNWPKECFAARVARLHSHHLVSAVLEHAPWHVDDYLMKHLGITKVVTGSIGKIADSADPEALSQANIVDNEDPYADPKSKGCFIIVESLNTTTEHHVWVDRARRVLFSNVDASIDWRILVKEGKKSTWGDNPGYATTELKQSKSDVAALRASSKEFPRSVSS